MKEYLPTVLLTAYELVKIQKIYYIIMYVGVSKYSIEETIKKNIKYVFASEYLKV